MYEISLIVKKGKSKTKNPPIFQDLEEIISSTVLTDKIHARFYAKMSLTLMSHDKFLNRKDWGRGTTEAPVMDSEAEGVLCSSLQLG